MARVDHDRSTKGKFDQGEDENGVSKTNHTNTHLAGISSNASQSRYFVYEMYLNTALLRDYCNHIVLRETEEVRWSSDSSP